MTGAPTLSPDAAARHVAAWDAQQTGYIRHRDDRFRTIALVVAGFCRSLDTPRILDLAGGPGSLGAAVLAAVPHGELVILDKDPALLALAAQMHRDDPRVTVLEADLDTTAWVGEELIRRRPFDAVVSSTALHWLQPDALIRTYFAAAEIMAEHSVILNGDHFAYSEASEPTLRRIAADDDARMQQEAAEAGAPDWDRWWSRLGADPEFADAVARREQVWRDKLTPAPKVTCKFHLEALRSCGFIESGTVWQYLDDYVVYGLR
ncbi:class I SAM-dependent methyltransferase [Microbacterium sp.]|uniref:class I SAM-dependent methyltransferase n=1 Tax=Microbacterium sp. TaxID=51671 RepID=UPI003A84F523